MAIVNLYYRLGNFINICKYSAREFLTNVFLILTLLFLSINLSSANCIPNLFSNKYMANVHVFSKDRITFEKKHKCEIISQHSYKFKTSEATIKCRGGFSSKFYKHSYRIELKKKYSLADLPKEDDWIFNANYIDKTFMRHKISYDLFREMSADNIAPKCAYINLYLNNQPKGIYVLMQRVNGKLCRINKKDKYACVFKDPPVFFENKIDNNQPENNYYDQKFPKIKDENLSFLLDDFNELLFYANDSTFEKNILNYVDIDNVIDWHILLLLTNNADGLLKNFYLYKIDHQTPFRFAIWDYDHSFGRDGDNEYNMLQHNVDYKKNIMLKRLMESKELKYFNRLSSRYCQLRKNNVISVHNIYKMIIANHNIIKPSLKQNFDIWPVNSSDYYDTNNYYEEVAIMREYIKLIIPRLDNYFGYLN